MRNTAADNYVDIDKEVNIYSIPIHYLRCYYAY